MKSFNTVIGFLGFSLFAATASADPVACVAGGKNVWPESYRTGKAMEHSISTARTAAYSRFLANLADAAKDCIEDRQGYVAFGPIYSSAGLQPNKQYWATYAVEVGCCVGSD